MQRTAIRLLRGSIDTSLFDPYIRALYILAFLLVLTWIVSRCGKAPETHVDKVTPADIALTKAADIGSNVVQTIREIATSPPEQVDFHSTSFEAEGDVVNIVTIGKGDTGNQTPETKNEQGLLDIDQLLVAPHKKASDHTTRLTHSNPVGRIVRFLQQPDVEAPQTFILRGLEFQSGSSELTSGSLGTVQTLAAVIKAYRTLQVRLDGHTDNVGDPDKNKQLSTQRAESVMNALTEAGADPKKLSARGFGEERPIAENTSKKGQRANRRVEVIILHK